MTPETIQKLIDGQTVYMKHPDEDCVAALVPDSDLTVIKWKNGNQYSVKDTTDIATDIRVGGTEITEQEYNDYG